MAKNNVNKGDKHAEKIVKRTMHEFKHHHLHTGSTQRPVKDKKEAMEIALEKVRDNGEVVPWRGHEKTEPTKSMKTKSTKHKRKHDDKW